MTCRGCIANSITQRASELLGRRYTSCERRRDNFTIAAGLLDKSAAVCHELRHGGHCQVVPGVVAYMMPIPATPATVLSTISEEVIRGEG